MSIDDSNEGWRVPPELDRSIPRRIKLNGMGIAHCVIAAACLAFGAYETSKIVKPELRRQAENETLTRQLNAEGRETEGTVIRLYSAMENVVFYDYTVDGQIYRRGAHIALQHWQTLQVGSPLEIRYLPSDPSKASPVADPPNSQNNWGTALPLAGVIWFFMLSFAIINLSALFPKRHLLARGLPVRGAVTGCKAGAKGRSSGYFISYYFSLPDGSQRQGKAFRGYSETEGSSVTVLFDHDQPERNTLYPMGRCVWELAG